MSLLVAFDCDGVLRDESTSYQRCVTETVAFFDSNIPATAIELDSSMKVSNNDWERTHKILTGRNKSIDFSRVKNHFQDLYLGKDRDFTGYIANEPWLVDNLLLKRLACEYPLAIISGAPRAEIEFTLRKNSAIQYFELVLGMEDCDGKRDGLEKALIQTKTKSATFCDDRPSPLEQIEELIQVYSYGIIPPQNFKGWTEVLTEAGAEKVFDNVNDYCGFILNEGRDLK